MTKLSHKFVEFIPDTLEAGVLYVSITHGTAVHRCCCGCGREVVMPFTPTDWKMIFDGETISLYPSIGNWSVPCRSHYWITRNRVEWADDWSAGRIEAAEDKDLQMKERFYGRLESDEFSESPDENAKVRAKLWWARFRKLYRFSATA